MAVQLDILCFSWAYPGFWKGGFGRDIIRLTSRDNGDVTRITACLSPHSSQVYIHVCCKQEKTIHDPEVLPHAHQDPLDIHILARLRHRWLPPWSLSKRSVILLFAFGGSAVDCLRCRLNIAYAISA